VTALVANEHGIFGVYSMRECSNTAGSGRRLGARVRARAHARGVSRSSALRRPIARVGIAAGATFDRNSGLPMTLYTVALKP
jgi:hypothetical protein